MSLVYIDPRELACLKARRRELFLENQALKQPGCPTGGFTEVPLSCDGSAPPVEVCETHSLIDDELLGVYLFEECLNLIAV